MSKFKIPYETVEKIGVTLEVDVVEKNLLKAFIPEESAPVADLNKAVAEAVENPIGGEKFSELIGKNKRIVFMTENQFRPAPAAKMLFALVKKAIDAGSKVSVVVCNGKVPSLNKEEIRARVGNEVVDMGIPVYCNDVSKPENYAFLGNTLAGTPLFVLKEVAEADAAIAISSTEATLWGYGGSGMVIPGCSSNETIETNHVMSLAPDCIPGNNECKMQYDKYEALKMTGIRMGINMIVSNRSDVIYVNAGDPIESHKAAVEYYNKIYKLDISNIEKADIVITGTTAPTDHIFFHTNWAIVNCTPIAKDGATNIMASPCPGYGDWPGFALMDLMQEYTPATPESHERVLKSFFTREKELWAGCIWYPLFRTMLTRNVKVVTLPENLEAARKIGFDAVATLDEAYREALEKHGRNAKVAIVPYGRYTVLAE